MREPDFGPDVAILLDHFGAGGVERVACHLANGLQKRGFRVEMVVVRDAGPVRHLLDSRVSVHVLNTVRTLGRGGRLLLAAPDLARYLRQRRPALLHSPGNHTHKAAGLAVRLARYDGVFVPKITNPILKSGMSPLKRWLRRTTFTVALERAAKIIVLSPSGIARLQGICPDPRAKAAVLPNPYVGDAMTTHRPERGPAETPLILAVGRLTQQKDFPTLLRAVALLKGRKWRLRICGIGPEADALQALAAELGVSDRMDLAGFVDDVASLYSEADVMVLSSRWEDLPAALIEAIASGCPVVSTACSIAVTELLETVGAAPPAPIADAAALSVLINRALDGDLPPVDPEAVAAYGIEASCDAHAALFSDLLAANRARQLHSLGRPRALDSRS